MKKILSILFLASFVMPCFADEPQVDAPEPATLIIMQNSAEFIVLRSTGTEIAWAVESGFPKWEAEKPPKTGKAEVSVNLGDVFSRIASTKSETPREREPRLVPAEGELPPAPGQPAKPEPTQKVMMQVWPAVYTLIFMDSSGVKTCVDLSEEQCKALRHSLRAVFDDILKQVPPFKSRAILSFIIRDDVPKQVSRPVDNSQK